MRGFHALEDFASRHRDTASSGQRQQRPEEVLSRRKANSKKPIGEESYFAHESLPSHISLPSSNILEAAHAYTAHFYKHQFKRAGKNDYQSMDETALLAMGILLEELADEALGHTGDLVLVEGESADEEEMAVSDTTDISQQQRRRRKRADTSVSSGPVTAHEHLRGVRRKFKRRRVRRESDADQDTTDKGK